MVAPAKLRGAISATETAPAEIVPYGPDVGCSLRVALSSPMAARAMWRSHFRWLLAMYGALMTDGCWALIQRPARRHDEVLAVLGLCQDVGAFGRNPVFCLEGNVVPVGEE